MTTDRSLGNSDGHTRVSMQMYVNPGGTTLRFQRGRSSQFSTSSEEGRTESKEAAVPRGPDLAYVAERGVLDKSPFGESTASPTIVKLPLNPAAAYDTTCLPLQGKEKPLP